MNMRQCSILLIMSVVLFAPHIVSAQDSLPRAHFMYSPSLFDDRDFVYNIMFESSTIAAQPDIMTKYYVVQSGTQTIEFTISDEDGSAEGSTVSAEINFEAGNHYAVISVGAGQAPIVINETVVEEESGLPDGENALTIISTASETSTGDFKVSDNVSPTPQERTVFEYSGYLQSGIGQNGVILQRLDPQTQAVLFSINIPYFPNTDVIVNGDRLMDATTPVAVNYSTSSSAADWLAGISQMENAPFTFDQFINSAVVGGFDAALAECEDYMWFVWTDAAYGHQSVANQTFISGAGASTVVNNSVLEGAIITPWLISPTQTRGGTPLFVGDPLAELEGDTSSSGSVSGNILMTVSTMGNNVQNVIHITDAVPLAETTQNRVDAVNLYPSRTSVNFVLPLGG
jgi:hypothetical protein